MKIDLVRAIMQLEGNVKIVGTCFNYDKNGGVEFSGYSKLPDSKPLKITMDKHQVEAINQCSSVMEIYECYKEMEYF